MRTTKGFAVNRDNLASGHVRVVEATTQQRPPASAPAQPASAPPPARGFSVRGRPSGEAAGTAAPPPPQAPQPQPGTQAQPPQGQPQPGAPEKDKPESSGDDASARFSLLELD